MDRTMKFPQQHGFSILEILIAILMFAIGMLALASLQGSLTRSAADANLRTTAANIAERTIEDIRGFGLIDTDLSGTINAYADIVAVGPATVTDGLIPFTRTIGVTEYYYDLASDTFVTTPPLGVAYSDFKEVTVTVAWGADAGYETDDANTISSTDLGSGSITASAFVSSLSTLGSSGVTTQDGDEDFVPFVNYTPGQNPDIVSVTLATGRFKESLTPEPEVIRADEFVETRLDVITYSQSNASLFLRQEEFVAVSCECTLRAAPSDGSTSGRRPAIWAGDEYIEPEFVAKAYGEPANNQQSAYCDSCCQDHHDGGTGSNDPANDAGAILYDPYRNVNDYLASGDHKHYKKSNNGDLTEASAGDVYVEACRLVRKDGFLRVAQDFSMEGLNVFPYNYLVSSTEVMEYSTWLTDAVSVFTDDVIANDYDNNTDYDFIAPDLGEPSRTEYNTTAMDGDLTADYTILPTALNDDSQQLRSRGIYVDYMTTDLRGMLGCLVSNSVDYCNGRHGDVFLDKTGTGNALEIIPFFEVQLTYLNNWTTTPLGGAVTVSMEPLETDNTHDRGTATKVADTGNSYVMAEGHHGVPGFTDTDAIDLRYSDNLNANDIRVIITTDDTTTNGTMVTGVITSGVNGVQARNVEIAFSGANCNRTTEGFSCLVPTSSSGATLTLSNYHKQNDSDISACSYEDTLPGTTGTDTANRPFAVFDLDSAVDTIVYQISIENGACSG